MKIGILTHHYINNFGAFLQAYALQTTLQELFKDDEVVLINDLNLKHFIINTGGWFRLRNYEGIKSWFHKIRVPITFAKERKKYFNLTPVVFSAKGITADSMKSRAYGLRGRTNFSIYRFDRRDGMLLAFLLGVFGTLLFCMHLRKLKILYFPVFIMNETTAGALILYILYGILCMLPLILNIAEDRKWRSLRSEI